MSAKAGVFHNGALALKESVVTSSSDGFEGTAHKLAELAVSVTAHAGFDFSAVAAVGIGSPGVINSKTGEVIKWSNYSWNNVPLGKNVSARLNKPVFVTNDANAAALGEAKFGAGSKYENCILITLGTGVGGGVVLEGKLYEGFMSAGGELGHTVIEVGGRPCGCGRKGCFEQYASATALIQRTREGMLEDSDSLLWEITNGSLDKADGRTSFKAAKFGDKTAQKIVDEYVHYLGEGIANMVNIFRPQAIMLGGGVSNQGEVLLAPLREYINNNIYVGTDVVPLDVVKAQLGNDAGIYGAYAYAVQRMG